MAAALPQLAPVDQYGLIANAMALSLAGYQPMQTGLDFLDAMPAERQARKVVQRIVGRGTIFTTGSTAIRLRRRRSRARRARPTVRGSSSSASRRRHGEPAVDAVLRPTLIGALGKYRDPHVLAEATGLFAAGSRIPNAIPDRSRPTWLGVIARNADAATWDAIHERAQATTGHGRADLALSAARPRAGRGAGAPRARPRAHRRAGKDDQRRDDHRGRRRSIPRLAIDFVLAHLAQVNQLIDISGRSRFMQRLAASSRDAGADPGARGLCQGATSRRPTASRSQQAIDRIRSESAQTAAHPQRDRRVAARRTRHGLIVAANSL